MKSTLQNIHPIFFLIVATTLEVSGDALIRRTIYEYTGTARIGFGLLGMLLLFGYGFFLNLAPVEFGKVVGLYIATLFIVWQIITYLTFKTVPALPVIVGGSLVVAGGLIITFWKTGAQ
jgi:small multidrug resistance family-3 protein